MQPPGALPHEAPDAAADFFELSRDMLCVFDAHGRFISVNPAWTQFLGYTETELLGKHLHELVHPEDRDKTSIEARRLSLDARSQDFQNRCHAKDGSYHCLDWNARLADSGMIYARASDVTEQLRSAQQLRAMNAELQRRAAELERSNADLSQFAYVAAHDLSEPLRTVASFAQLLERRYRSELDERADRYISHIVCGAERMRVLIDDLLEYSSILKEEPDLQIIDAGTILGEAWASLRLTVLERGGELTAAELPQLVADPGHARLLFHHLLSNSLKFCEQAKPVIEVRAARESGAWLLSVTDNGIGIDVRHADRVFGVFERLHASDAYEGTGIGLAVCKRLVERHGGKIWAEPAEGGGTRVSFTLPDLLEARRTPAGVLK